MSASELRDKILANHAPSVRRRAELEYDVISALLTHARKAGYRLRSVVWDEETKVTSRKAALELIFDLDESELIFTKGGKRSWVKLVMGNDGWDVVSDYGWDGGDDVMKPNPGTFAYMVEEATRPFVEKYS